MTGGNALYEQFRKAVVEPAFFASPYVVETQGEPKRFGFLCRWRRHRWTTWVRTEDAVKPYQSRVCRRCNLQQTEDLIEITLQDREFVSHRPLSSYPEDSPGPGFPIIANGGVIAVQHHVRGRKV